MSCNGNFHSVVANTYIPFLGSALIAFSDWHLVVDHINTLCVVIIIVIIIVITIIIMFIITTLQCIGVNV